MFNIVEFVQMAVPSAAALLPIVMAFVTWLGKLGVQGKLQFVASMATGLVFGGVAMYFQVSPQSSVEWFATAAFGLVLGLSASGVYEVGRELAGNAIKDDREKFG